MDENSRRNLEAAERAERYLKGIPPHLRGPATRILVSESASVDGARVRGAILAMHRR